MLKRIISLSLLAALVVWELFVQPVWNINVERWAESRKIDGAIDTASRGDWMRLPDWASNLLAFLAGDFLIGAASVAAVFLVIDLLGWLVMGRCRQYARTLGSLAIEIHNVERSIRRTIEKMPSGANARIRPGVPTSLPLDDAMKSKAVLAQLGKHGIPTPDIGEGLGFRASKFLADYFATVYPFVAKGLRKEAKREAAKYLSKVESQSNQSPPKIE
ncbi:hypothetical protein [Sediminimonas qiaohouensis]|uniref:hypothetical protein n=1 Tax=Sediminimonas qiaohouensis TaxID=552061 RepID=UPI0012EEC33C|nr:hypothetical protein [Sediminimonas qiaohouensis]